MAQIGTTHCSACDFQRARVNEGKNGTLSIACSECGTTAFVKSPAAVGKLRARLGGGDAAPAAKPAPRPKPAPDAPEDDDGDDFGRRIFGS